MGLGHGWKIVDLHDAGGDLDRVDRSSPAARSRLLLASLLAWPYL
jgi:hypothetical protein